VSGLSGRCQPRWPFCRKCYIFNVHNTHHFKRTSFFVIIAASIHALGFKNIFPGISVFFPEHVKKDYLRHASLEQLCLKIESQKVSQVEQAAFKLMEHCFPLNANAEQVPFF